MRRFHPLLAMLVVALPVTARAQFPGGGTRPVRVVVSGGLTVPAGDLKDFHDTGFHYDASLLLNFPGLPLTLRPEISLTRLKVKSDELLPGGGGGGYGSSSDVTQLFGALGNVEVPLAGGLYVMAGGGLLNLKTADDLAVVGTGSSQSKFTFDAGAGLRFKLGGIAGFVEGRIGTASYDEGTLGFSKAQYIPVTFGLVF